jgi:long-chain acyl-CoA synthetase
MQPLTDFLNFGNIFFNDKTYSPETIRASIDAVAENLTKRFISNSPFVYLFAPNHIKTVYALFGIIKSGRICVLVDPALKHFELEEMIKDSPPGALIRPDKETDIFDFYKEIEYKHYKLSPLRLQGLDDVAIMLYTAADDGYAKGAMLTHENILSNARALIDSNNVNSMSVSCSLIAQHHLFALQTGVIAPSIAGGNLLIENLLHLSSINKISNDIDCLKVTHIYSVPLIYYCFQKLHHGQRLFSSVKSLSSGGCKLPLNIFEKIRSNFGLTIHEGYGLSEASPMCAWHRPNDEIKIESVGRSLPCCQIKILNDDNFELPIGQSGEVCVNGPNVMKGYYAKEIPTKMTIINSWLHTGDLGKMDEKGFIYLSGIKKRILNVGGNKVYPAELERLMKKHNDILNVEVSGESDELLGHVVKAIVRLRNNSLEAQKKYKEWCFENITKYKVPKVFNFLP